MLQINDTNYFTKILYRYNLRACEHWFFFLSETQEMRIFSKNKQTIWYKTDFRWIAHFSSRRLLIREIKIKAFPDLWLGEVLSLSVKFSVGKSDNEAFFGGRRGAQIADLKISDDLLVFLLILDFKPLLSRQKKNKKVIRNF